MLLLQQLGKRSTGPSTESGRVRSKMNALKHGLSAKAIIIEGEDPRQFEALRAGLERDFEAPTVIERELVEDLSVLLWRQRRVPRFEAAIIQRILRDPIADDDEETRGVACDLIRDDILTKLSRYETSLINRISRTLNQLHDLRASRVNANDALRLIESAARPTESATEDNSAEDNSAAIAVRKPDSDD
jgi:hypothetical protein